MTTGMLLIRPVPLLLSVRITYNPSQGDNIVNSQALERHSTFQIRHTSSTQVFIAACPPTLESAEIPVELLGVKGTSWSYGPLLPSVRSGEAAGGCHCPAAPSSARAFGFTPLLGEEHLPCLCSRVSPATGLKPKMFLDGFPAACWGNCNSTSFTLPPPAQVSSKQPGRCPDGQQRTL